MITFKIIGLNTGFYKGKIEGLDYQDAENKCLDKGLDMYDTYTLAPMSEKIVSASPLIEEILNY